jgi:hypothetical protein
MDDHKEPRVTEQATALDKLAQRLRDQSRSPFGPEGFALLAEAADAIKAIARSAPPEAPTQQASAKELIEQYRTGYRHGLADGQAEIRDDAPATQQAGAATYQPPAPMCQPQAVMCQPAATTASASQEAQAAHAGAVDEQQSNVAPPFAAPAGQQEITRLDVLSLIREHTHRCYVAGVDMLEVDQKYMREIEDGLRSFEARAKLASRCRAQGGETNPDSGKSPAAIATSEQKGPQ